MPEYRKSSRNYGRDDPPPRPRTTTTTTVQFVHLEYLWNDDYQGWWWTEVVDEVMEL